jgi:glutaredoxin
MLMELRLFTLPTCSLCPVVKAAAKEVAEKLKMDFREVNMATKDGMTESAAYQIMSAPTILVDDEVIIRGKFISKERLEQEVSKRLEKWKARTGFT